MIKKTIFLFFILFGITLNVYTKSLDVDKEADSLSDFIFWQKHFNWDRRSEAGYFESLPPGIIEALEKASVAFGDEVKFSNELYKLSGGKSSIEPLTRALGNRC